MSQPSEEFRDPRTTVLVGLGLALWVGSLLGSFWSGPLAMGALALGGAGAALAGWAWAGRKPPALPTRNPKPKPARPARPAPVKSEGEGPASFFSLDERERLVGWLAEPIAILEEAETRGALTGFNQARSCLGMGQLAAWRRSAGASYRDADALTAAAQEAVASALIEAAEYFSPLLELMGRRGEEPIDLERQKARMVGVRRQTIATLSEIRSRMGRLPVSGQESFGF